MSIAFLLAALALAGPVTPGRDVRYEAVGAEPFWTLTIDGGRIVLQTSEREGEATWPATPPRTEGGMRIWESGAGDRAIRIEARPGPCETEAEEVHADNVLVRADGLELTGCGGPLIRR